MPKRIFKPVFGVHSSQTLVKIGPRMNSLLIFRWEESKKWKHKVEILKSKLKDADTEVSKLSKTNKSLREINRYNVVLGLIL